VLADLLEKGVEREKAYRIVQAAANRGLQTGRDFGMLLVEDGVDVSPPGPQRFLVHHDVIRDRLEALRGVGS